ncbi:MAG TPA: GNAT family N-acetyltransferase [Methylomirabilota bacterium]|nr:GNAT family N-acetyltransferase [Methylomirabilota bacterium]
MSATTRSSTGRCVEVQGPDELTLATAPALGQAVARLLRERPSILWLNLEAAKVVDAVGLAVVAQAVHRAGATGARCVVFPSHTVYRGLFQVRLLDHLPIDKRQAWERGTADVVVEVEGTPPSLGAVPVGPGLRLARPTWDDLRLLETWAHDAGLGRMVGSQLLELGRHFGAYDPDFVAACLASPTSLMFLVHPLASSAPVAGFVRLYGINLGQRLAFLETVIAPPRRRRTAWGVEASRLMARYAIDALGLHRLETKVYADNVPCVNALRRHGFTLEGRLRGAHVRGGRRSDVLVFGIVEPEIRAGLPGDVPRMTLWPDERA